LKIGVTLGHAGDTVADTVRYAVQAEEAGLPMLGMGDAPSLFREVYGLLMASALATRTISLGPTVSNPVIRNPYVTASAVATIDEASQGRAYLGFGTGNASVRNLGLPKAKIAQLEEAVVAIREAFLASVDRDDATRGKTAQRSSPLEWPTRVVPIIVSAGTGPRSMKVAADHADGVLLHTVCGDIELVERRVAQLREMRANGPRAGEPFEIWTYTLAWIADSIEECREVLGSIVTASLGIFDLSREVEGISPEMRERLRAFQDEYSFSAHASAEARVNVELMEKFGVTDFMFGRVAVYGSASDVAAQVRRLEAAGVDGILVSGGIPNKQRLIESLGALQSAVGSPS